MKFVAKPEVITAHRFINWEESAQKIKSFVGTHFENNEEASDFVQSHDSNCNAYIWDRVDEEWSPVKNGQWIVRAEEGEFDVVNHKLFVLMYNLYKMDDEEEATLEEWQIDYTHRYNALDEKTKQNE